MTASDANFSTGSAGGTIVYSEWARANSTAWPSIHEAQAAAPHICTLRSVGPQGRPFCRLGPRATWHIVSASLSRARLMNYRAKKRDPYVCLKSKSSTDIANARLAGEINKIYSQLQQRPSRLHLPPSSADGSHGIRAKGPICVRLPSSRLTFAFFDGRVSEFLLLPRELLVRPATFSSPAPAARFCIRRPHE